MCIAISIYRDTASSKLHWNSLARSYRQVDFSIYFQRIEFLVEILEVHTKRFQLIVSLPMSRLISTKVLICWNRISMSIWQILSDRYYLSIFGLAFTSKQHRCFQAEPRFNEINSFSSPNRLLFSSRFSEQNFDFYSKKKVYQFNKRTSIRIDRNESDSNCLRFEENSLFRFQKAYNWLRLEAMIVFEETLSNQWSMIINRREKLISRS